MAGDASVSSANFQGFTRDTTDLDISFANSNVVELGPTTAGREANLYFTVGFGKSNPKVYKLSKAVINEATLDFDIDGIATINWSGFASTIAQSSAPTVDYNEDISATDYFIRNRLT